jgi:Tol biopolymer transport system component
MPYFKLTFVLGASAALAGLAGAHAAARSAAQPWTIGLSSNRESRDAEIYAVRSDGTGVRRLTRSPFFDGFPVWSPDRKNIAFHSQRSAKGDVWVIRADGERAPKSDAQPRARQPRLLVPRLSWSPDSRRIAFQRWPSTPRWAFFVMNADGGAARKVTWSPPKSR